MTVVGTWSTKMNQSASPRNRSRQMSRPEAMTGGAAMARHWYRSRAAQSPAPARAFKGAGSGTQDLFDLLCQGLHAVGLGDELHVGLECTLADEGTLEVARGEQHLQAGPQLGCLDGQVAAGEIARHDDVGEQEVDPLAA